MGLLTGALQIGRSALLAYQSALQVTGNNISNAGSASYTRQSPVLMPDTGVILPEGFMPGGGVALDGLKRNVDEALLNRLRASIGTRERALVEQQVMGRIEGVLQEWTDNDLSTLLSEFFNAMSGLQNQPHEGTAREIVLTRADSLVREIRRQRDEILSLRDDLNKQIEDAATRVNQLADDIANLNLQITELESSGAGAANALRDRRDDLLSELAQMISIQVREQPGGSINVYVGNEPLIQGGLSRGVTTTLDTINGEPRITVRYADNNGPIALGGGRLGGLVSARDGLLGGQIDQLDRLAAALIQEVNKVHASGQGIGGFSQVTGTYAVLDPDAALNSARAGLDLNPRNGSFLITLGHESGSSVTTTITVDLDGIGTDDTLASLVDKINNSVANVTASVTADNRLRLVADTGYEITFSEDSSNVLAALGVNTFFDGSDAQNISVNAVVLSNRNMIAAATNGNVGDGSNAARLAGLGTEGIAAIGNISLLDYYNLIAADVAVKGAAAKAGVSAADTILMSLSAQRESVSGVSLDEETISLLRFERAFQGAARYTSVVDRMIEEMLALVR